MPDWRPAFNLFRLFACCCSCSGRWDRVGRGASDGLAMEELRSRSEMQVQTPDDGGREGDEVAVALDGRCGGGRRLEE